MRVAVDGHTQSHRLTWQVGAVCVVGNLPLARQVLRTGTCQIPESKQTVGIDCGWPVLGHQAVPWAAFLVEVAAIRTRAYDRAQTRWGALHDWPYQVGARYRREP